ncbi:MAG TPA: Asp-tRNA(Asn)/Glu-tRNA(Gln) amidotransferase GatCAB subunit B, partial [Methanobacteriaceae archaeon]|nr:Asp-tRNA(Asn)/Glu-tRNA(Gln) amidotransferase GatCAB subunit B [Methanobacteriaceae archaeon]
PLQLVELFKMLQDKKITTKAGQRIMEELPKNSQMPKQIAEEMGLVGVVEEDQVLVAVKQAIEENPDAVSDYYSGQKKSLNFLVGQVMRLTRGKADPANANKIMKEELAKGAN